jgi:hypothetical protein
MIKFTFKPIRASLQDQLNFFEGLRVDYETNQSHIGSTRLLPSLMDGKSIAIYSCPLNEW